MGQHKACCPTLRRRQRQPPRRRQRHIIQLPDNEPDCPGAQAFFQSPKDILRGASFHQENAAWIETKIFQTTAIKTAAFLGCPFCQRNHDVRVAVT